MSSARTPGPAGKRQSAGSISDTNAATGEQRRASQKCSSSILPGLVGSPCLAEAGTLQLGASAEHAQYNATILSENDEPKSAAYGTYPRA